MSQESRSTISGSVWDVYTPNSQEYKENRMPRVGQVCCFEDGRRFVFCATVVDVAQNTLVGKPAPTGTTVGATSPATAGQRVVKIDGTDVGANYWKGGHLSLDGMSGLYKIKANKAVVGAGLVEVTLYDPLLEDVAGGTDAVIFQSQPWDVIVNTGSTTPIGVAPQAIPAATNAMPYFFWVQTAGLAQVAGAAAVGAPGTAVMPAAAGAVAASDGTLLQLGVVAGLNTTDGIVDLYIREVL